MAVPTDIAGLVAWFKAEDIAGVDGDPVSTWPDASGNGRSATQSGTPRPTLKTGIVNGMPVARFDGTDDRMPTAAFTHPAQWTIFAVSRSTGGSYSQSVVDADSSSGTSRFFQFRYASAASFESIAFNNAGGPFVDSQPVTAGSFNILTARRDASAVQTWVGGVSNGSTATTGTPNTGSRVFILGAFAASSARLTGDIAEVIYYDTALSPTDRAAIEAYLTAKYFTAGSAQALAGVSAGSSTDVGALATSRPLAGQSSGSSTDAGVLSVARPLAGQSAGASTDAGALSAARPLAGVSASTSEDVGAVVLQRSLAGLSAGDSSDTAAIGVLRPLAGQDNGQATDSGSLAVMVALAGVSAADSADVAAVALALALAGVDTGTSTDAATLALIVALAGVSSGSSADSGVLAQQLAAALMRMRAAALTVELAAAPGVAIELRARPVAVTMST